MVDSDPGGKRKVRKDPWPPVVVPAGPGFGITSASPGSRCAMYRVGSARPCWLGCWSALHWRFRPPYSWYRRACRTLPAAGTTGPGCQCTLNPERARMHWLPNCAANPECRRVVVTTQDEALAEFLAQTHLGDALGVLDTNPLPSSLRVVLTAGADSAQAGAAGGAGSAESWRGGGGGGKNLAGTRGRRVEHVAPGRGDAGGVVRYRCRAGDGHIGSLGH